MKTLIILLGCFMIAGCSQPVDNKETKPVSVETLNAIFVASWNKKDSLTAVSIMAENAIVMNDSLIYKGINEIARNWIRSGLKVVSNIETVSLTQGASETIAYDGGTYSLDVTIPGGPVLKEKGNYSFVWTKTNDNIWKLALIHIEDITRIPEMQ